MSAAEEALTWALGYEEEARPLEAWWLRSAHLRVGCGEAAVELVVHVLARGLVHIACGPTRSAEVPLGLFLLF